MWTKEEHEKYKLRRKPVVRFQLNHNDLSYLKELFEYLKNRGYTPRPWDSEMNNKLLKRFKVALERLNPTPNLTGR